MPLVTTPLPVDLPNSLVAYYDTARTQVKSHECPTKSHTNNPLSSQFNFKSAKEDVAFSSKSEHSTRPQRTKRKLDHITTTSSSPPQPTPKTTSETLKIVIRPPSLGKDKPFYEHCLKILQSLMRHKFAWPFNQPVDPIALQIPDYFDVIKNPMDLGTVMDQLKKGRYTSTKECFTDIRLVFSNAILYNPPHLDVHKMAQTLLEHFEMLTQE